MNPRPSQPFFQTVPFAYQPVAYIAPNSLPQFNRQTFVPNFPTLQMPFVPHNSLQQNVEFLQRYAPVLNDVLHNLQHILATRSFNPFSYPNEGRPAWPSAFDGPAAHTPPRDVVTLPPLFPPFALPREVITSRPILPWRPPAFGPDEHTPRPLFPWEPRWPAATIKPVIEVAHDADFPSTTKPNGNAVQPAAPSPPTLPPPPPPLKSTNELPPLIHQDKRE